MSYGEEYGYDPDAVDRDDDEEERQREGWEASKEVVVFAIDASPQMFQTFPEEGVSYFEFAVRLAKDMMKMKIISSTSDEVALIFYNTQHTNGEGQFEHVYMYYEMDVPDAHNIKELERFTDPDTREEALDTFMDTVGSATLSGDEPAQSLKYLLWLCGTCFEKKSHTATKRVLLFSNDEDPCHGSEHCITVKNSIMQRVSVLADKGVTLQFFPLLALEQPFSLAVFWAELLDVLKEEDAEAPLEANVALQIDSLYNMARKRIFRKRPLASLRWAISEELQISVQMFSLVQPAVKPSAVTISAETNEQAKLESALICADTGAILTEVTKKYFRLATGDKERFPKVVFTDTEIQQLKAVKPVGLKLLGFKCRSALKDYHQIQHSNFLYPNEQDLRGSRTAFIALHAAMLSMDKVAICSFVRNARSAPVLVALLAQEETFDLCKVQILPPGMHLIYLPFADDLRAPEAEPLAPGIHVATDEQISAAAAMAEELVVEEFDTLSIGGSIPNPVLQRHYELLEAAALEETAAPIEEFDDKTLPNFEEIKAHKDAVLAFKQSVYGSGDGPVKAAPKGTKRKDPENAAAIDASFASRDWVSLAKEDKLSKLTVADLKVYLRHKSLPLSGNKPEVIARIKEHVLGSA